MQNVNKVDLNDNKNGKRKRRRQRNMFGYYILVIFLTLSIGFSLSVTLLFNIKKIVIRGTTQYENADIIRTSGVIKGDNLIRLDTKEARKKIIENMLYIDDAVIKKGFPDKLYIDLTPSEKYAYVECKGGYMIISKGWKILELSADTTDENLITVNGFEPESNEIMKTAASMDKSKDKILHELLDQIAKQKIENIVSINLTDKYDIEINYENRITIIIGNSSDIEYKLKYAYQLLNETKELGKNKRGYLVYHEDLGYSFITSEEYNEINSKLSKSGELTQTDEISGTSTEIPSGEQEQAASDNLSKNTAVVTQPPYNNQTDENTKKNQVEGADINDEKYNHNTNKNTENTG